MGKTCRIMALLFRRLLASSSQALRCGGNPDLSTDREMKCALHYAARNGFLEGVSALLDAMANPNAADNWGNLPLDEAEYWAVKGATDQERHRCWQVRDLLARHGGIRGNLASRPDAESSCRRRQNLALVARRRGIPVPWEQHLPPSLTAVAEEEPPPPPPVPAPPLPQQPQVQSPAEVQQAHRLSSMPSSALPQTLSSSMDHLCVRSPPAPQVLQHHQHAAPFLPGVLYEV
ncbi:unnamed protein product [Polarella glacialis]|uniref:Glutaminase n=1 Tax=Polarella glacialis TaxID=89957 RepID=A0A813IHR9_POLGL|nr:unnamed protein product [Polarella glacialis]CAE8680023.1 unnamed protein product [Polarella glacialis]